jgi:hypothetical protein
MSLLVNLILILIGPFVLVGGQALIAELGWFGWPIPRRRAAHTTYRPTRTAVAW